MTVTSTGRQWRRFPPRSCSLFPFLPKSSWIYFPWENKKQAFISSQQFTSLPGTPLSHHFSRLAPAQTPAQVIPPAHSHLLIILNHQDQLTLFVSKWNSQVVAFFTPFSSLFLTHWELEKKYYSLHPLTDTEPAEAALVGFLWVTLPVYSTSFPTVEEEIQNFTYSALSSEW